MGGDAGGTLAGTTGFVNPSIPPCQNIQNSVFDLKSATESSKFNSLKLQSSSGFSAGLCVTIFTTEALIATDTTEIFINFFSV